MRYVCVGLTYDGVGHVARQLEQEACDVFCHFCGRVVKWICEDATSRDPVM